MKTIFVIVLIYICIKIIIDMDLEKTIKFFLFGGLSILPAILGLLMFDYSVLYKFKLINDFGTTSLIGIVLIYTGIAVLIRLLMFSFLSVFRDRTISAIYESTNFITLFYGVCIDVFIYSSIPIIITYYKHGNYIHFIENSLIVWFAIFIYWLIWSIFMKDKQMPNTL